MSLHFISNAFSFSFSNLTNVSRSTFCQISASIEVQEHSIAPYSKTKSPLRRRNVENKKRSCEVVSRSLQWERGQKCDVHVTNAMDKEEGVI